MGGIDAPLVATEVVYLQSGGYGADEVFIDDPMDRCWFVLVADDPVPLTWIAWKYHAAV